MENQQPSYDLQHLLDEFDPFLRSRENDRPSSTDSVLLKAIARAEKHVQSYDARMKRAQAQIDHLKAKRAGVIKYLNACDSFTRPSPITKIPVEVLGEIFEFFSEGFFSSRLVYLDVDLLKGRRLYIAAATLAHVCSQWRLVVHRMPSLISSLHFNLENDSPEDVSMNPPGALHYLASIINAMPSFNALDVQLRYDYDLVTPTTALFLDWLSPYLSRIRYLNLEGFSVPYLSAAECTPGSLRSLHSLFLDGWDPITARVGSGVLDFSVTAPNLSSLKIRHCDRLDNLTLDWERLLHLSISECPPHYILFIIKRCINLQSLTFDECDVLDDIPSVPSIPLILQHIKRFKFRACNTDFLQFIHSSISMQSLQEGYFELDNVLNSPFQAASFASNPFGSVQSMTKLKLMCYSPLSYPDIRRLFAACSMLETVVVKTLTYDAGWVEPEDTSDTLFHLFHLPALPNLRHLELALEPFESFEEAEFLHVVQSRWYSTERKLESVILKVGYTRRERGAWSFTNDIAMWLFLRDMQREGLKVHVEDGYGCVRTRVEETESRASERAELNSS